MSVIVHGMDMPGSCKDCIAEYVGVCMATGRLVENDVPDWCPLEEVMEDDMR